MNAKEYIESEYGTEHLKNVIDLNDQVSLFGLMDEYAEWKVKNCSVPDVVGRSEQLPCYNCADWKQGSNPDNYCLKCNRMVEL